MFAKKLLYLSDNHLAAWLWQGGKLARTGDYNDDGEGLAAFEQFLAKSPQLPIHILVDVIEEDFRNETIPHILGKDRQALVLRKLNQLFRGATYRHADLQGREQPAKPEDKNARRDDKLLLTGLTNEDLLKPWVERIAKRKLPLAGVYSLPLLSQQLAKKLGLSAAHQLLISRQTSGLRQSYFQDNQIKFSRLTLLTGDDMLAMQATVNRESQRTQQYLNSLRLLPRDKPLEITLICGEEYAQHLQPEGMDTPMMRFSILKLADVAAKIGLKAPPGGLSSEILYLHLLGRHAPSQHYAPREQLWYNQLRQLRGGILGATAATIAVAAYVVAMNFNQAFDNHAESEKIVRDTAALQSQYQSIKNNFPPLPDTPDNMKSAVELVEAARRRDVMPETLMGIVSHALETSPALTLNKIKWSAGDKPEEASPLNPPPPSDTPSANITIGMGSPYQTVTLEGEVKPFTGFRNALDSVNLFIETLSKTPSLQVTPLTMPIDIGPTVSQQGSTGNKGPDKAAFSVKLILPPAP